MDDLTTGLAKAQRQPWLTRSTGIMAALVIACLGFVAGIKAQQSFGATPASSSTQQQGGGTRPTGFTGGANSFTATPTTGKVKLVDGTTLYIELADGSLVTVKTTGTTVVSSVVALKDLQPGTDVSVIGSGGGTDTMTATAVTAKK